MKASGRRHLLLAGALAALVVVPAVALASGDREGRRAPPGRKAWKAFLEGRREGQRGAIRDLLRVKRRAAIRGLKRLADAPEEQVRAALDTAVAASRVREQAREKAAAAILAAVREGKDAEPAKRRAVREALRERLRALRDEAAAPLEEAGRGVVATLTPEQRAKVDAWAKARGKTADDAALARWMAWRLSRPEAVALLKARLAEGK